MPFRYTLLLLLFASVTSLNVNAGAAFEIRTKAGQFQTSPAFTAMAQTPSVIVLDSLGNPVAGVTVTFAVETGGGSVTGAVQVTGADGIAAVGSWTLGPPGNNTISATAPGLANSPLTLVAIACGPPVTLEIFAGNNQVGTVARFVRQPCVIVKDALGTGVPGVEVTFAVAGGGGAATGLTQITNGNGIGIVESWQLGPTPGVNQLESRCAAISGSRVVFDAFADPETPGISGPFVRPLAPIVGQATTITAIADLQVPEYHWNFGDGMQQTTTTGTVTHTYSAPGSYQVSVQAMNLQHTASANILIVVYRSTEVSVEKKSISARNPSAGKDTLSLSGKLTLPPTLTKPPTMVVVRFGAFTRSFDLSKNAIRLKGQSFKLSARSVDGVLLPEAKFTLKGTGDLAREIKAAGLAAGASGDIEIPLQIVLPEVNYAANSTVPFAIKGTAKAQSGR